MKEKAIDILGMVGTMISGSKSGYCDRHPNNLPVFNSNLIVMESNPTKIWHGDLDLTLSLNKLKDLASELGVEIRVLREHDARFEYEEKPRVEAYVIRVEPDGSHELGLVEREFFFHEDLTRK